MPRSTKGRVHPGYRLRNTSRTSVARKRGIPSFRTERILNRTHGCLGRLSGTRFPERAWRTCAIGLFPLLKRKWLEERLSSDLEDRATDARDSLKEVRG